MNGPGQEIDPARAMVVIIDTAGVAHAWDVEPITRSEWEMIGMVGTRTKVRVTLEGSLHRRSRQVAANFLKGITQ